MRGMSRRLFRSSAYRQETIRDRAVAEMAPEPTPAAPQQPAPLVRGGRSRRPGWFVVMAMLNGPEGLSYEFVAEAPTEGESIALATRYHFRALVVSPHSKRVFDNFKPIESLAAAEDPRRV